jgi:DNA-binding NarL/FixJ family response regulator
MLDVFVGMLPGQRSHAASALAEWRLGTTQPFGTSPGREREVLALIAMGERGAAIAAALLISPPTVEN